MRESDKDYLFNNVDEPELHGRFNNIICSLCDKADYMGEEDESLRSDTVVQTEFMQDLASLYATVLVYMDDTKLSYIKGYADCYLHEWAEMLKHRYMPLAKGAQ